MTSRLAHTGDDTLDESVGNIWEAMLTDQFVSDELSWTDKKGDERFPLATSNVFDLVCGKSISYY